MTGSRPPHASAPDLRAVAEDWITIVQSELAALVSDREAAEIAQAWLAVWANAATALVRASAGPAPPARPAAAAAASDAGRDELAALRHRIEELERRLAELGPGHQGGADRPARRDKSGRGPPGGADGGAGKG